MASPAATPDRSLSYSASTPAPLPSSRNNPIALRIYKAIGTSFDDPSSREALEVASSFYASSSSSGTNKGRGLDDDSDGDGADDGVVIRRTLRGESASVARKCLKRDVESKMAGSSQKFLEAFGEVDKKLDVLREHMREMQLRCDQVQSELDQANSGTKYLLERADGLRSQRASAQLRATLITLFLSRFTLSDAETAALTSRDVSVGPALFAALDRVRDIRRDCSVLLGAEEGKMQAGLDIMAATSEQIEAGYKKLHRWLTFEFRQFTKETQLEVSSTLREAVKRLGERPQLLEDALLTLTSTRSSSLLTSFLTALTSGGPGGLPRPIELHAHDPIRYVGDMLAWVHQTTASEHEFLEGLFGVRDWRRMVGSERRRRGGKNPGDGEQGEDERQVAECLDKDLEALSRPLKMRIQQTIKSQEGIIMTYKIANLLQFYLVTMRKTIGEEAALSVTLKEIYDQSYAAFLETLNAQGRSLLRFLHPPDTNLTPPLALRDATSILREIISVYTTSLSDTPDEDFPALLDRAVDPCVEMCERMAVMVKGGDWEKDVFMGNCLGYLQHALEDFDGAEHKCNQLSEKLARHVESMTFEHHGKLLEQSGLAAVMKTIRTREAGTPLSRLPATSPKPLTQSLAIFSTFLTSIDPYTHPRLALLSNARMAEQIHRSALRRIAEAYGEVCERVLDKKEGYEFGETMLRRGRAEVEVALGVTSEH